MISLSFVVCCYNSSGRLAPILEALALQNVRHVFETIVVDNASTDDTRGIAAALFQQMSGLRGRTVIEPNPGRMNAMIRGIQEAQGEFVCFVDDDNRLDPAYAQSALDFLRRHPQAGAIGGTGRLDPEIQVPDWFPRHKASFAVGEQNANRSPDEPAEYLWGAGLVIRREAVLQLLRAKWRPTLLGRTGREAASGDDSELVSALRVAGWNLYYVPSLTFTHVLAPTRLNVEYLLHLHYGFGRTVPILMEFLAVAGEPEGYRSVLRKARRIRLVSLAWCQLRLSLLATSAARGVLENRVRAAVLRGEIAALLQSRALVLNARASARELGKVRQLRDQGHHRKMDVKRDQWATNESSNMVQSRQRKVVLVSDWAQGPKVLDLGSNDGAIGHAIAERHGAFVVAADLEYYVGHARRRYALACVALDATRGLPFNDGAFDTVVVSGLLEYMDDPIGLLLEARRLLAQQGRLVLVAPNYFGARRFARPTSGKNAAFTVGALRSALESVGFVVNKLEYLPYRSDTLKGKLLYRLESLIPWMSTDIALACVRQC